MSRILGELNPFAVGLVAASPVGLGGVSTLFGAVFGYLMSGSFIWALKYISMSVLTYTALFVFRDTKLSKRIFFPALSALTMSMLIGAVYGFEAGWNFQVTSNFLIESVIICVTAYFYKMALSPWESGTADYMQEMCHAVSVLLLLSTSLVFLSQIVIFDIISVGRALAMLLVLLVSFKGGLGAGCACGVAVGIAMDAAADISPFFCMVYAFSGLISGIFSKHGRLLFAVSFISANAAATLWSWKYAADLGVLYEAFIASVAFVVLPGSAMAKIGMLFPSNTSGYGVLKAREYTKTRVEQTANVFSELGKTVSLAVGSGKNDNGTAAIFDRASELVCRSCPQSSRCWQHKYETTLNVMNNLTPKIAQNGMVEESDFPKFFTEDCEKFSEFLKAINDEIRSLAYRQKYKARLRENVETIYSQYSDISVILHDLASELGSNIVFEPTLERKLQKYLRSMDIDASTAVFRDKGGRLHAEITTGSLYSLKRDEQYLDKLSAVLGVRLCTSHERNRSGKLVLLEAEPFAVSVGIASIRKQGQSVSGDRGTYFKTDEGLLYILLSDGMGTGDWAAKCSGSTVDILEKFLRSGVAPETALNILNNLMLIKNETETICATIDLMCINLFTGDTSVFKFGAAPTYIRKGDTVKKIKSKKLAIGLESSVKSELDNFKMKLSPSSFAVIISDGVLGGSDDIWLGDLFAHFEGNNTKDLARAILKSAADKYGCEDDMTVLAVYIEERP